MLEMKFKNQILTTIDQLRKRKARPDITRICKYMWRLFKVLPKDTKSDLKKCVNSKAVYQVQYKGNISFRNAAKCKRAKSKPEPITAGMRKSRTVLKRRANSPVQRQSMPRITRFSRSPSPLASHKSLSRPSSEMSDDALSSNTKLTSSSSDSSPIPNQTAADSANDAVRVGARPKRAKKVFDPSDVVIPVKTKKRGRPVGSLNKATLKRRAIQLSVASNCTESTQSLDDDPRTYSRGGSESGAPGGVCSVCRSASSRVGRLIECRDCNNKAHTSCLKTGGGVLRLRPDSTWQCPHCKTCVICCETNDAGVLTVCSMCADAYHAQCHDPPIITRQQACDQWECSNCLSSSKVKLESKSPSPQNTNAVPRSDSLFLNGYEVDRLRLNAQGKVKEADIDPTIPDIRNWTKDDVFDYFSSYFPEVAHILKNQELDGHAVLVARREDIVRGLGLALGPALKLYRHVVKLQARSDNFSLCWG